MDKTVQPAPRSARNIYLCLIAVSKSSVHCYYITHLFNRQKLSKPRLRCTILLLDTEMSYRYKKPGRAGDSISSRAHLAKWSVPAPFVLFLWQISLARAMGLALHGQWTARLHGQNGRSSNEKYEWERNTTRCYCIALTVAQRESIYREKLDGHSINELAQKYHCSESCTRRWWRVGRDHGVDGLHQIRGARPG